MSNITQQPGYRGEASQSHPEDFTENATGAESSYVHGGQRPLENPPKSGAKDVSPIVQDQLAEMHVDSKLSAQEADGQKVSRTEAEQADLDKKRTEGFKNVDERAQARAVNVEAMTDANNAVRDRTLAVQEEIATRERDGAMPGTPAFARRQDRIREIVGETKDGENLSVADRITAIASSLHMASPGGIEEAQHELMAIAAEIRGDKPNTNTETENYAYRRNLSDANKAAIENVNAERVTV